MSKSDYLALDFETFGKQDFTQIESRMMAQQEEDRHNELNCEAIMARLGPDKVDELFTAILLVFGPVKPKLAMPQQWMPGQSFWAFRDLLQRVSGIPFSLTESIVWFQEYRRWLEESSRNIRSDTKARPSS